LLIGPRIRIALQLFVIESVRVKPHNEVSGTTFWPKDCATMANQFVSLIIIKAHFQVKAWSCVITQKEVSSDLFVVLVLSAYVILQLYIGVLKYFQPTYPLVSE
jgi:hypothetical protein